MLLTGVVDTMIEARMCLHATNSWRRLAPKGEWREPHSNTHTQNRNEEPTCQPPNKHRRRVSQGRACRTVTLSMVAHCPLQ